MTTTTRRQDEWMISDGMGEYVRYYNPTGVMVFTRDRNEAMKTTDSHNAAEIARVARVVYGRKDMRIGIVLD